MAEQSETELKDTAFALSEQFCDMADTIRCHGGVLNLPKKTRTSVLAYYGESAAKIFAKESKKCVEQADTDFESEINWMLTTAFEEMEYLRTLPRGTFEAIQILPTLCNRVLDWNEGLDEADFLSDSQRIDDAGINMLRELLRMRSEDRSEWKMEDTYTSMYAQREHSKRWHEVYDEYEQRCWEATYTDKTYPAFKKSLELLRAWHSRETGSMLAMKVSGHALPPELVEHISSYFYDHEILNMKGELRKEEGTTDRREYLINDELDERCAVRRMLKRQGSGFVTLP